MESAERPIRMRTLALPLTTALLALPLAACGDDGDGPVAADPAPTTAGPSASASPTTAPTAGGHPDFTATDYTYDLTVQCFCLGGGVPLTITVTADQATAATYAEDGRGVRAGDPAPDALLLTIDQVIAEADDPAADRIDVDWPEGQAYPNRVYVDHSEQVADDETGYVIANVQVS